MDLDDLQADAKVAGAIIAAVWASLSKEQQAAIRDFAIRTGRKVATVAVHAILAYGSKRIAESGIGAPDLDALYASPAFPNPMPQEGP